MIVALGDLLLDISVHTEPPIRHETDCFVRGNLSPGGSAANFAVWAARLGASSGLIAKVGRDMLGEMLQRDLAKEGVQGGIVVGTDPTGFIVISVDVKGERTMLAARGATATLSAAELDFGFLDRADWLHVSAYSFLDTVSREAALSAMRRAKERGVQVSLDPASYGFLSDVGTDAFWRWVDGYVDAFFPNLDEGRVLTGEQDPDRILDALMARFPLVALKLGAQGALAGTGGTVVRHAGYRVPAVDTTGAGDAWAAAFVVHWLAQGDLAAALKEGNRLAAAVVQVPGARFRADLPVP
jgi:ribokinase